jgi:hypothetical protein
MTSLNRRLFAVAIMLMAFGPIAGSSAVSGTVETPASKISTKSKTFTHPWTAECTNEAGVLSCGVPQIISVTAQTPGTRSSAVVTVSFDYHLGTGDAGDVRLVVQEAGTSATRQLSPGRYPLAAISGWTSTSLSWTKPWLRADTTYTFSLVGSSIPDPGDDRSILKGMRVTMVVDVVPGSM